MTHSNPKNILVLVIDRLNAGYLGPYGNTWVPTPAFNRLASESLLAEFALTTTTDLALAYRSYWQGLHPLSMDASQCGLSLPEQWNNPDRCSLLLTDEPLVEQLPLAQAFHERLLITPPAAKASATNVEDSEFAELIAATCEHLANRTSPFAMWVHARGPSAAWDAPLTLREHLRDEDDPAPPTFISPPDLQLSEDYDPDELLAYSHAYAAQVMVIDECLELLLDTLARTGCEEDTLLVFTSPRGYALGQQRFVGPSSTALLNDQLHVPLLIRYPAGLHAAERFQNLLEPRDLHAVLQAPFEFLTPPRDRVLSISPTERTLRTPAWHFREPLAADSLGELYAKPDDRYEINNVNSRCQSAAEGLSEQLEITTLAIVAGEDDLLAPLADELVDTYR